MSFITVCLASLLVSLPGRDATAAVVVYDAALNTLPQAQGFFLADVPPVSPPPSVSGGILSQGPTSFPGQQFFERLDVPFNFDNGFTLVVTLKVISSTYDPNAGGPGSQRSGWYTEAIDSLGRRFIMGIDTAGVVVNTDASLSVANGIAIRPFNTTNAFHHYRLVVNGGTGTLFIDGALAGTTPTNGVVDPSITNRVIFGDGTSAGSSETQLRFFEYADQALPPSPPLSITSAPNAVILGWPAAYSDFNLQATSDLTPPALWTAVTNQTQVVSETLSVTIPVGTSRRFFRLQN